MSYNQLISQRQQEPSDSHNPNKVVQKNCVKEKKKATTHKSSEFEVWPWSEIFIPL